ncbi:MAG: hypothetical protein JO206_05340 [Solirubrobacterales bacterium]|nr:hypothetical protein [Solirubrobacterales bacterium]MBV9472371.1 hypothetical protein [Solirubrobacterales bacterium]
MRLGARVPGTRLQPTEINGSPGALLLDSEDRLIGVWALEIGRAEILAINGHQPRQARAPGSDGGRWCVASVGGAGG